MIQVEAVKIVELRGIRELVLTPERRNFVISGPNGSGKSGVVDAIQFGLTGEISRLAGKGTGGLTVQKHGPHVDRRDDPAAAAVSLTLYFPGLDKRALLTRNVKTAKTFTLIPDDGAARSVLEEVAQHPELTLSRREIIKYILVEAGERSKEIQALLKLEEIGNLRGVLKTARNKITHEYGAAQKDAENAADALRRHLDIKGLAAGDILAAVNTHRQVIGLPPVDVLTADTALNAGAADGAPQRAFNKATAIRDLGALREVQEGLAELGASEVAAILDDIATLEVDGALLEMLRQRSFVERGLALVGGARCPLCDMEWEGEEHLRAHLQAKLARSEEAEGLQKRLLSNAAVIAGHARRIATLLAPVRDLAASDGPAGFADDLATWADNLTAFARCLATAEDVLGQKIRLAQGWPAAPATLAVGSAALTAGVQGRPDQSASAAAHGFLTLAQDRLHTYRQARRAEKRAKDAADIGKLAYATYCDVAEDHLTGLYAAVENDFSSFYRELNSDDESGFKAKFEPAEGKLDLAVAFYDRGMFPPGAYHSEGHQDGMGVCLYLALMKRLLGDRFRFAVLDDVVMSVDQAHRKKFCRLLGACFPDTQFIITTHDKVWAKQMQTEGLVAPKSGIAFHSWSVQTGPVFEQIAEVWEQIDDDLARNDIETAASRLRRHLEYISGEVADLLGATPPYRGDFSYDLGDLLPAVVGRQGELLKLGAKSANSWNDAGAKAEVEAMKEARGAVLTQCGGEQWVINRAIHYNEWATFTRAELRAVVEAFKALLLQFRCPREECQSWLYVMPRKGSPEALRCRCMTVNLNLRPKSG